MICEFCHKGLTPGQQYMVRCRNQQPHAYCIGHGRHYICDACAKASNAQAQKQFKGFQSVNHLPLMGMVIPSNGGLPVPSGRFAQCQFEMAAAAQTGAQRHSLKARIGATGLWQNTSYSCPPGSWPPTDSDAAKVWENIEGSSLRFRSSTVGSGGGNQAPLTSTVFTANAGTRGISGYGGYAHFHVGLRSHGTNGTTTRVWYHINTNTNPVEITFSQILDG